MKKKILLVYLINCTQLVLATLINYNEIEKEEIIFREEDGEPCVERVEMKDFNAMLWIGYQGVITQLKNHPQFHGQDSVKIRSLVLPHFPARQNVYNAVLKFYIRYLSIDLELNDAKNSLAEAELKKKIAQSKLEITKSMGKKGWYNLNKLNAQRSIRKVQQGHGIRERKKNQWIADFENFKNCASECPELDFMRSDIVVQNLRDKRAQ